MPTAETSPKTREYWSDWVPNQPPTLSVDELLQRVQDREVECDLRTLRSWQTQGVLPYPVRQRKESGVYAAYPAAAVDLIALLRDMQGHGLKLHEIGPRLRAQAKGGSDRGLRRELRETLKHAAAIQEQITGAPVRRTDITFTDDVGRKSSYNAEPMVRWRIVGAEEPLEEVH